jgi:poly-gamma-glutamate synthesis protein (capsule biosynthesis protein)
MTGLLSRIKQGSFSPSSRAIKSLIIVFIISSLLVGCNKGGSPATPKLSQPQTTIPSPSVSITQPVSPTDTSQPEPSASPTQSPYQIWLAPYLPEEFRSSIAFSDGFILAPTPEEADILVTVGDQTVPAPIQWIYALVAPFPTITDGITTDELKAAWYGNSTGLFDGAPLLMDSTTLDILTAYWGLPGSTAVQVLPGDQLLDYAWTNQPSLAIIPFKMLEPRWKVLTINEQSPLRNDFDPAAYPLAIPFVLSGDLSISPDALNLPTTNRYASRLTTVAMTGVTAMVRATAFTMEQEGVTYPAQDIGPLLAQADITHISNEIPFWPNCPFPTPTMNALVFCSSPKYIDLLKAVGTDIVELTGDHFMDYGAEATLYTLQMYQDLGWPYYGGGANAEEARQPVKLENNGNRIAFMGCNVGCQVKNEIPCDAIATDSHPGAAQCDYDWLNTEIPALRNEGYQVIFTFQHREYYTYTTEPILADDFGLVAAAGATIVSGSQAHQSHGFAFENGSYIHYGLGNLFFDQYHYCVDNACDGAFIDQHVFYDGQYINTELITIRFVDFARPRLMTTEERAHFLEIIFKASGW